MHARLLADDVSEYSEPDRLFKHQVGGLGVVSFTNNIIPQKSPLRLGGKMYTDNILEPAPTYESGKFITDEETSDMDLFKGFHITKNIIMLGMVTLFVASAKTCKTTLISILANLIAAGAPDFIGNAIRQVRILYLTNEAPTVARRRFRATKRFLGIDPMVQNILFYGGPAFLITIENIDRVCKDLTAMGALMPKLIIIDPIASMFSGDMTNASDALAFRSCLDRFTELNIAVLCAHHTNRRATDGLDMDCIFGSQVFQSAFDSAFSLARERIENPMNRKQLTYTGDIIFSTLYQKDARPIDPVKFKKSSITMPFVDEDGDHPTSPFLLPYGCPLTSSRPDLRADR